MSFDYYKKISGKCGEDAACSYLKKNKYKIIERNHRNKCGEIDIIATKGDDLVFVEVKTRKADSLTRPAEAVGREKQKKLQLTAMKYLENEPLNVFSRFDVFEIWQTDGRIYKFNCIEAAFEATDFSGRYDIF